MSKKSCIFAVFLTQQTNTTMATYESYSKKELNARVALSEIQMTEGKTHSHCDVMTTLQKRTIQTA